MQLLFRATPGFERVEMRLFFFAIGGFTDAFQAQRAAEKTSATKVFVIPVDATHLDRWITSDNRVGAVTELYKRAVFDQKR